MGKMAKWIAITAVIAAVLVIGIGVTAASAATPTPAPGAQAGCGAGGGFRFGGAVVDEAVTNLLGMTGDEIRALRHEGKSLVEIAATRSISEQQLVDAIMEYKTDQFQNRVTAGQITQDQANLMLQKMEQRTIEAVNRTSTGPMNGRGAGNGQRGNGAGNGICGSNCTGQGQMNRWAR